MPVNRSYTAVVERNQPWSGAFATEPYEAAWAHEALFFVRTLKVEGKATPVTAQVQISPDGIHWCDEGTTIQLPMQADEVTFARVKHFGGWLRIAGELPPDLRITTIVYLSLKE